MQVRRGTTSGRRGFTILELLIVVIMIGALAAISMGRTSRIMTSWRMTRAAQATQEELQAAFALVGRNRKPIILEFRTDSMNLTMRSRPDAVTGKTIIYRRRNFGKDSEYKLSAGDVSLSSSTLEIYPPGLAADSLSIMYSKFGIVKRIRMMRGGLVQICTSGVNTSC